MIFLDSAFYPLPFAFCLLLYYCTEKIWDAIRVGCLPIYYGEGNAIYEDFPRGSFLDHCDFGSPAELFASQRPETRGFVLSPALTRRYANSTLLYLSATIWLDILYTFHDYRCITEGRTVD